MTLPMLKPSAHFNSDPPVSSNCNLAIWITKKMAKVLKVYKKKLADTPKTKPIVEHDSMIIPSCHDLKNI